MAQVQKEADVVNATNQLLKDEFFALQVIYDAINAKYMQADSERAELIDRLKELKEHEIAMVNDFNDKEQRLQMERLRLDLEEASKPNPALDAKALERKGSGTEEGCSGMGAQPWAEHYGDFLPESCKIKFVSAH